MTAPSVGTGADDGPGEVDGAGDAAAELAEPRGAGGAGLRARDDDLGDGVGEVEDDEGVTEKLAEKRHEWGEAFG